MSEVTIDVWVADLTFPGYMDRLHRLVERFNEAHPGHRIKIRGGDFRNLPGDIAEATARGTAPAVAEYYSYMSPVARDTRTPDGEPLFTSVEEAVGGREEILGEPVVIDDLVPGLRDYYSAGGRLRSMPMVATTMLIFANADLLRAAGLSGLPRTWDELEAACETVGRLPGGPSHPVTWANHGFFFQQGIAVQGGGLADAGDGRAGRAVKVDLASKEMLAWITWWRDMYRAGHHLYTHKIPDWAGNLQAFADGQVAYRLASSNDVNFMAEAARNAGFGMVAGRYPYRDGVPYGGHITAGTSLWLRAGLDEATRDGALAFMMFMNRPENVAERHKLNSFIPVTRSAFDLLDGQGWFAENPHHRAASDQLAAYPDDRPGVPPVRGSMMGDYAGVQDVMTLAMADVLDRDADPAARFTEATADAQRLLDAYNADCDEGGPRRPESLRMEYFRDAEEYSGATVAAVVRGRR